MTRVSRLRRRDRYEGVRLLLPCFQCIATVREVTDGYDRAEKAPALLGSRRSQLTSRSLWQFMGDEPAAEAELCMGGR